jgi:uncharacterized membrane protein YfbV (UPF0208 family)
LSRFIMLSAMFHPCDSYPLFWPARKPRAVFSHRRVISFAHFQDKIMRPGGAIKMFSGGRSGAVFSAAAPLDNNAIICYYMAI